MPEPSPREDLAVTIANARRIREPLPENARFNLHATPDQPRPKPELKLVVSNG